MSKRKTTKEFIADAIKKHGNKYDYSHVEYKGATAFVTIICPIHGEFQQRAADHIKEMASEYYSRGEITEKVYNALMCYKVQMYDKYCLENLI